MVNERQSPGIQSDQPIEIPSSGYNPNPIPSSLLPQSRPTNPHNDGIAQYPSSQQKRAPYPTHQSQDHGSRMPQRPPQPQFQQQPHRPLQPHNPAQGQNQPNGYPPRNPTRSNNHVFNIRKAGAPRPENHTTSVSQSSTHYGIGMPIKVPSHPAPRTIPAVPKPMFSSLNRDNGDPQILRSAAGSILPSQQRVVIDLTQGDKEPKTVSRITIDEVTELNHRQSTRTATHRAFGAPDPNRFLTSEQATQDMKALLSGEFQDEEDTPKLRIKKRSKPQTKPDTANLAGGSLGEDAEKSDEEEEDEDVEDGTVEGLAIKLLPHQVEGVAWMLDRENGKRKKGEILPRGGILADDMGLGKTVQTIALLLANPRPKNRKHQDSTIKKTSKSAEEIPDSHSHSTLIVAPLALIKQWESEINTKLTEEGKMKVLVHHGPGRTTSPTELKKYDVVITTYHILSSEHASSGDISQASSNVGCFGVEWYRVVLDEAHSIKNRSAKCSQASYALQSWYRWCLTGTPMQNNLDELQSLIRFLRIRPYSEYPYWKEQITGPMKNGNAGIAIQRLQLFLKAVMKRRTKDLLRKEGALSFGGGKSKAGQVSKSEAPAFKIQPRTIEIVSAEFNHIERKLYDKLSDRAQSSLDKMRGEGAKQDYIGALVLLLRLRQACNHPELVGKKLGSEGDSMQLGTADKKERGKIASSSTSSKDVDDIADLFGGLSVTKHRCEICQVDLPSSRTAGGYIQCVDCAHDLAETLRGNAGNLPQQKAKEKHKREAKKKLRKAIPTRKSRLIVGSDDEDEEGAGEWLGEEDSGTDPDDDDDERDSSRLGMYSKSASRQRSRPSDIISLLDSESEGHHSSANQSETDDSLASDPNTGISLPFVSTKIRYLMDVLKKEISQGNKTIVFSEFTSMLNLVEPFLKSRKYSFVRYDGGMRNDHREASLHSLREDPDVMVLLCSLKCGGLGLNLTAACRVVLLEPFWNPFAESQAIDRVHRLNQTKPVHVYRFTITDTVEERILRLQDAKRALADAALEGTKGTTNNLSFEDIMNVFSRNATAANTLDPDNAPSVHVSGHFKNAPGEDILSGRRVVRGDVGDSSRKDSREKR